MIDAPVKFLLVDDNDENLVALEALLRRDGLELIQARSGAEALELLLVHDVALAILDVQMPEMSGFELAELMRGMTRTKHVPIIFLTAGAHDPKRVFDGYEAGAVDFLFKPVEPHMLKSKADVFFELQRHRLALADEMRMHEMFVGVLGHDLRNPLAAIVTTARHMERKGGDEGQLRSLRRIVSSASRMNDMIEQLLDLTRARLGGGLGFVRTRGRVDVAELVGRTVDELGTTVPGRQLVTTTVGDCHTAGDATRLLQVFSNLVSNALQHGERIAPIEVTTRGHETGIEVVVHNGGAIAADLLPRIFDPFRGARSSLGARSLGLGLFISKEIVEAHHGTISATSTADEGTSFVVTLPRIAATSDAEPEQASKRVLVVDDDEDVRESARMVLLDRGYEPTTAASGREALDLLADRSTLPDVVVLDLLMPGLDGTRVYQAMRADPALARIPVVVSTGNPEKAPAGALVLPKPIQTERLLATIEALCREPGLG